MTTSDPYQDAATSGRLTTETAQRFSKGGGNAAHEMYRLSNGDLRMSTERGHSEHHVVGPVHVVTVTDDDADAIAAALTQERDECSAHRVIIDITEFAGALGIVLDGAHKSGWVHDIMVRTADQRHLTLAELEEEADQRI